MANARITHVGVDVLRQGDGKARITHVGVDVLLPDTPALEHVVTGVSVQVANDQVGDPDMTFTQEGVEAVSGGDASSEITQEGIEAVSGGDASSEITQEGVEVIWFPEVFPGCDSQSVFYRVRIRLLGATEDLAQYTSLPTGDNSIVLDAPNIDASTIDVLKGETTVGGCTVRLADPDTGTCLSPSPTTRWITQYLADAEAKSQLLGARMYIEATDNPAPAEEDWLPYWGGYVASLRFVNAITVEFSGAHTTRDDSTTMVWKEPTTRFSTQGYIMGGPTLVDWPSSKPGQRIVDPEGDWIARVTAVTSTYVEMDIDEDASAGYTGSGEGRAFPPLDVRPYLKDRGLFVGSNNDQQRNVFKWAERNVQGFFAEGGPDDATTTAWKSAGTEGWFPRLRVKTVRKNSGFFINEFPLMATAKTELRFGSVVLKEFRSKLYEDLGNKFRLYWPAGGPVAQPLVNDEIAFYLRALDVSEANPLLINEHPVDILTGLWDEQGIDYDAASATAAKAALGDFIVALRITEPMSLKDAQTMLCGGFGLGWRFAPNGLRYLFTTRVRPALSGTITLDDLISDDGVVWENDESSRVFSASYKWKRFAKWPGDEDGATVDRAFDGVMPYDVGPIIFQTDDLGNKPFGARDEQYEIPGSVYALEGGEVAPNWTVANHVDITANLTAPILEQFGRGAITTTLNLNHCVLVQEGEDWELELPHRPGFDALETPVAQRGIVERVQCISRTPQPWGSTCTFVRVPQDAGSVVPSTPGVATAEPITLSVVVHDATATGGNVITEADVDDSFTAYPYYTSFILAADNNDYYDLLDAQVFVDYYEGPAEPLEGQQTRYANAWDGLNAIEIGGFTPASKVWYRTEVRLGNGYIFPFSAWASVQLSNTTQAATPTVSLTPDGSWNIDAEIVAAPTTVRLYVAADTTTYPTEAATLLETPIAGDSASLAAIIPTLAEGETAYVTAIAEDIFGNRSIVSTSFFTRPGGGTGGGGTGGVYAGAMREIASVTTSGSQSSVVFSGIAGTYKDLRVVVNGRGTASALATNIRVRFNGDTSSSYAWRWSGPLGSAQSASDTGIIVGEIAAATSLAGYISLLEFEVGAYNSSAFSKATRSRSAYRLTAVANDSVPTTGAGFWNNAAVVTQIEVACASGAFVDGTQVTLYGIGGEVGGAALAPIYTKYDPFCPPAAPSSLDDEFTVDQAGTPAGWTLVAGAGSALTRRGKLVMTSAANAAYAPTVIEKTLPSGPFTILTHAELLGRANFHNLGLTIRSSVSGRAYDHRIYIGPASDSRLINCGPVRLNSYTSENSGTVDQGAYAPMMFLRIVYDGTTLFFEKSYDGTEFYAIYSEAVGTWFTGGNLPDRVGLHVEARNGSLTHKGVFSFFRYAPTAFADLGRNVGVGSDGAILEPNALYLHNKVI